MLNLLALTVLSDGEIPLNSLLLLEISRSFLPRNDGSGKNRISLKFGSRPLNFQAQIFTE